MCFINIQCICLDSWRGNISVSVVVHPPGRLELDVRLQLLEQVLGRLVGEPVAQIGAGLGAVLVPQLEGLLDQGREDGEGDLKIERGERGRYARFLNQ